MTPAVIGKALRQVVGKRRSDSFHSWFLATPLPQAPWGDYDGDLALELRTAHEHATTTALGDEAFCSG